MKKLILSAVGSAILLTTTAAIADTKIGVLDIEKVMKTAPQIASINKEIETKFKGRHDKIIKSQQALKTDMEQFQRNASVMKDADRTSLQNKILNERNGVQSDAESFQQDLSNFQNQSLMKFMGTLKNAVNKEAQSNHYDLILLKQATAYYNPNFDVTDAVLKDLGTK